MAENNDGFLGGVLGALPLAGAIFDPIAQGISNRKQRKWAEKMYNRQREDALADWQRMNEYNSPGMQMSRLKEAGLNPNLVYGHGVEGNAAGAPRASSAGSWNPKAPTFDGTSVLAAHYNTELQKAQIELTRTNNEVRQKDVDLKDADILSRLIKNRQGQLNFSKDSELYRTYIDVVKQKLANMQSQHDIMYNQNKLIAGRSYNMSMQNLYWDKTLQTQVDLLKQRLRRGNIDINNALIKGVNMTIERALNLARVTRTGAEVSRIYADIDRLKETIPYIQKGVSLRDIEIRLKNRDLWWQPVKDILKGVTDRVAPVPSKIKNTIIDRRSNGWSPRY